MKFTLFLGAALAATSSLGAVDYEADILPIFSSKCGNCHLDGSSKGGLALDLDKVARDIGEGKSIVPGDSGKSDLVHLVSLPDDDGDKMPPEGKGRPMTEAEITKLKEWIDAGAAVGNSTETMDEEKPEEPSGLSARPEPIEGDWTNTSGKTIRATLVRVDGANAILRMNGKDFTYPLGNLDATSRAKVEEFAAAWNKASGR